MLIFPRYLQIERTHTWAAYLAWKTLPNAPSPISLTYSILFLGYSRLSSFGLRRRGIRWYMGLGCSRSRRSSEGRVVSVGVSDSLKQRSSCWSECAQPPTRRSTSAPPGRVSSRMEKGGTAGLLKEPCSRVSHHFPKIATRPPSALTQALLRACTGAATDIGRVSPSNRHLQDCALRSRQAVFQSSICCLELSPEFYLFLFFHCFRRRQQTRVTMPRITLRAKLEMIEMITVMEYVGEKDGGGGRFGISPFGFLVPSDKDAVM